VNHTYASAGTYTVSLIVTGAGGASTNMRTSYIVASPNPTIGSAQISNGKFILSGSNGPAGVQYRILGSTNLDLPLASWTPLFTNLFAADGSYSYTNSSATNAASFFQLVSP
jgi:PKD repeat protein